MEIDMHEPYKKLAAEFEGAMLLYVLTPKIIDSITGQTFKREDYISTIISNIEDLYAPTRRAYVQKKFPDFLYIEGNEEIPLSEIEPRIGHIDRMKLTLYHNHSDFLRVRLKNLVRMNKGRQVQLDNTFMKTAYQKMYIHAIKQDKENSFVSTLLNFANPYTQGNILDISPEELELNSNLFYSLYQEPMHKAAKEVEEKLFLDRDVSFLNMENIRTKYY